MAEFSEELREGGCEVYDLEGLGEVVKCSSSFVQKFPDKPWTVLVRKKSLEGMSEKLLDTGLDMSRISIGTIEEGGAWGKVKAFDSGDSVYISFFDRELLSSDIERDDLREGVERMRRLSERISQGGSALDIADMARAEVGKIADELALVLEKNYTASFGTTLCVAEGEAKKTWVPKEGDKLQFKVVATCELPEAVTNEVRDMVEAIGERKSFKIAHRDSINTVLTPDRSMYLRKIVLHDRALGGPFVAFGVADRNTVAEPSFIKNVEMLERHLSHI